MIDTERFHITFTSLIARSTKKTTLGGHGKTGMDRIEYKIDRFALHELCAACT